MPVHFPRLVLFAAAFTMFAADPLRAQISVFSAGYLTPENIVVAPSTFGAYGGQYFINDAGRADPTKVQIFTLPASGGSPASFSSNLPGFALGALFLPSSGWGSNSGHYLTVGSSDINGTTGQIFTYDAAGQRTSFYSTSTGMLGYYAQTAIAPASFGSNAGKLFVSDEVFGLFAFDSNANIAQFTGTNGITPFALAFAPSGFGKFGNMLFTDDVNGGMIEAIDANGNVTPFADAALKNGQSGLRQLAFAPAGFLPGFNRPLLFVSVSGSTNGGGTLGDILAFTSDGTEVASLRTDLGLSKFDPRGLYFLNNGSMLVNDSSDPILLVTPGAFNVVPEPAALPLLAASGLMGAGFLLRRRRLYVPA